MVKPRAPGMVSAGGLVTQKPVLATNWRERDAAVRDLVDSLGEAVVEERIRGEAWRVHFVRTRDGIATLTLRSVRSYPVHTGQSSVQQVAPAPPGLVDAVSRLLDAVGYEGPGSAQVIVSKRGQFVHDVNLRFPVTVGATITGGLDMPRLAVAAALGDTRLPERVVPRDATYVSLLGEARHLLDGLRGREVTARPGRIAADLALAVLSPRRVLDPVNPRDPLPILLGVGEVARRLMRSGGSSRAAATARRPRSRKA
jgi:hypothetical protein